MATITPHILKSKLPNHMSYPLKYKDIEKLFGDRSDQDLHVSCRFWDKQAYWKADRNKQAAEGRYVLCELRYNPDLAPLYYEHGFFAMQRHRHPVLTAQVHAVDKQILKSVGLTRSYLHKIVDEQLSVLTPKGLTADHWHLDVWLLAKQNSIECRAAQGKYPSIKTIRIELQQSPEKP